MANVDPLAALTAEEMAELLRKKQAEKQVMASRSGFNPAQYAPTYGAAAPPGLPADFYNRQAGQPSDTDFSTVESNMAPGSGARFSEPVGYKPGTVSALTNMPMGSRRLPPTQAAEPPMPQNFSVMPHAQDPQITPERAFEMDYGRQAERESMLTPPRFGSERGVDQIDPLYARPDLNLAQAQAMSRRDPRIAEYIEMNKNAAAQMEHNSANMIWSAAQGGIDAVRELDPELVKQYWGKGVQMGMNEVFANATGAKEALANLYMLMPEGGVYHNFGKDMLVNTQQARRVQDAFRAQMAAGGFDPEGGDANKLYQIIEAVGGSALVSASTAAMAITAGLPIALATMGGQVFNTTLYNNLNSVDQDGNPTMSAGMALEDALVETALEIATEIPLLSFLRGIPKQQAGNIISNVIKAGGIESLAEGFNSAAGMTYKIFRHGEKITPEQFKDNLIVSMGAGAAGGITLGGTTTTVAGLTKLAQQSFQRSDPGFEGVKAAIMFPQNVEVTDQERRDAQANREILIEFIRKEYGDDVDAISGLHFGKAKDGSPTFDVGRVNPETGKAEINVDDIMMLSRNMNDAMRNIQIAQRHEGGHVLLGNESEIRDKFFEDNKTKILSWLENSPTYEFINIKLNEPSVTNDPLGWQRLATEEYIMAAGERDIGLSEDVQLAVLGFARDIGINVSAKTNARLLLKDMIEGNADKLRVQAESGGLQSQSRREFMQKAGIAGAGLAVDPTAILEPGVQPDAVSPPVDTFAGGIMRPGVAPEYEGVLRAAAADSAAPTTGLVSDVASRAFDDYDAPGAFEADQRAAAEERAETQRRLDELKAQEDQADEAAATEVEEFETMGLEEARLEKQKVLEETHRILDEIEEAQQESLKESLDSGTAQALDRKSIKLVDKKYRRDTQNWLQKNKILEKLEGDALAFGKLVHRLNSVPHMKGRQSIGLETAPLDRDGFRAIMTDLVKGDTTSAEAFIESERAILQQIQDAKQEAQASKAQAAYAERVGKDRTALAPRRKKGTVSELEGIMTPPLAKKEIDAQLEAGDINQATYDQKLERIAEIQSTVKKTSDKRKALTQAVVGDKKIGRIPLGTMQEEAFIGAREKTIPVPAKQPRPKAEVRAEQAAAIPEGTKVTRIPADPDAAIKGKIDFDKGTTKREQRYGLDNIAADADIFTELDDMRTEQGEELGEGYSEVLERKSIKAVKGESYKDKKKRGSITITKVHDDGTVEYKMTTPKGVATGKRGKEGFDTFINTFYQDYAVASRASKPFIEWAKQHPEYQKEKYWDGDKVVVGEFVENFDKLWNDATLAGVKVPTDVARLESELRSDRDPGVRQIKNKVRDMNTEYESFLGEGVFTPDHLSELLGSEIIGDVATGKDVVYSSPTSNMHAANNLAIMPKLVHDAVNAWIKAGRTASERAIRKNSPNKYTGMINDAAFIASNSKYKNIPDFIKAVGKLGNMTNAREIERGLLNATAKLLVPHKKSGNAPWNKAGWKATPTPQDALLVDNAQNTYKRLSRKLYKDGAKDTTRITADFTSGTMRTLFQYIFGAPVKRIADFNKMSAFGVGEQGTITAATVIANAIQRSLSSQARPEGMEQGTDLVQETSLRTGEFYSRLFKVFAGVTNNEGIITPEVNAQIVDHIAGKPVEFTSKSIETAAKELKTFMEDIYQYAKDRTSSLETPLDLRGAGDSVLPRVWNIDYIATTRGKKEFLAAIANKFTDPDGKLVFQDAGITPEDLYAVVVNSGGFVQGEWTNIKADQTTSQKEIEKDQLMQEYLDSLSTEELADAGLLVDDLQSVIPRFVQKAVERAEYSAVFGVNDEILRSLVQMGVDQIKVHNESVMKMEEGGPSNLIDDKAFQKAVWDMSKILRNKFGYDMADMPTRKWLQRIANVEVVAKLPLVTLASLPEFFTPMLKGDVRPDKFAVDFALASAWAGYKGMNGLSKLVFNKHLPAMLKHSSDINGLGIISDIQLLREMGIADIQSMGDTVATRYANPNFARGGIRAATRGTVGAKIPKGVRAVFNMQTYMQATMLTTITEMQQFMALRNYQRHMMERVNFVNKNKGKALKGRSAVRLRQYKQDLLDYGVTEDMDLSTPEGEAAFNAGALRFIDQVITRPNDATTAKISANITAPYMPAAATLNLPTCLARSTLSTLVAKSVPTDVNKVLP